jgi:hypothetical protein
MRQPQYAGKAFRIMKTVGIRAAPVADFHDRVKLFINAVNNFTR